MQIGGVALKPGNDSCSLPYYHLFLFFSRDADRISLFSQGGLTRAVCACNFWHEKNYPKSSSLLHVDCECRQNQWIKILPPSLPYLYTIIDQLMQKETRNVRLNVKLTCVRVTIL